MNLENFVQGLTIQEREELLDILLQNTENSTTMPPHIKEAVATDEANEMKTKLEEAGATVTLK